jgi:homoserine kinase type II
MDDAARQVLCRYAQPIRADGLIALGNHGGFSGAQLWQIRTPEGSLCLRAWPPGGATPQSLAMIHRLMQRARQQGLGFVPAVIPARNGETTVEQAGRLWDLVEWLPGRADFHQYPAPARLEAACTALAWLHAVWSSSESTTGPCPAIDRRWRSVHDWLALVQTGWRPTWGGADPLATWSERAWFVLAGRMDQVPRMLSPWTDRSWRLQPCLCDVWHDHVLFDGDVLTGLIDYGSVKTDQVAVDLARLLGSLVGDNAELRAIGLRAYGRVRPLAPEEEALVAVLDETGTLLAAANWLRWLYYDGRRFEDRDAVARRLAALVERIERWNGLAACGLA